VQVAKLFWLSSGVPCARRPYGSAWPRGPSLTCNIDIKSAQEF
jgi:hypothetical protein